MLSVDPVTEVQKDAHYGKTPPGGSLWRGWAYLLAGAILLAAVGTWLVWFSASVQRRIQEEEIRAACQRVMPASADRCYDTVIIQRGGVRR